MKNNKFLGEEKISKLLCKFAVPCIFSLIVSALYNIVDQIFVGNHPDLGYLGNAATSIVFPATMIAGAFAWCLGDGVTAMLSIKQGKKNADDMDKYIANSIMANLAISVVFVVAGYLFREQILRFFGATDDSIVLAREYFNIILAAFPVNMVGMSLTGLIRADGAPTYSMIVTLTGAIINIIFDPILIYAMNLGIQGAAYATIGAQIISFLLAFSYLFRAKTFKLKASSFKFNLHTILAISKLGISTLITNLAVVAISIVSNIMLVQFGSMSKYGADIPIAVLGITCKVFTIVLNISIGLICGAQPIIGYNIGARKYDRVRETFKKVMLCSLIACLAFTAVIEINPNLVINIFGSGDALYNEFAQISFRVFLSLVTFTCLSKIISIFFQAVGEPLKATICSLIRDIIFFIPLAFILPNFMGVEGVLWASPIADLFGMAVAGGVAINYFRKLGAEKPSIASTSAEIKKSRKGVIIAISRQHGSAGKYIGELIAKELNVPYYYKEAIAHAAKESGLDADFIDKINEGKSHALRELYLSSTPVEYAIEAQNKALKEIAKAGSCVIVGRAADYVLRNNKNVLRVFIHAPEDYRIEKLHEMYGDTKKAAKKNLAKSDKARSSYYKAISGQNWGDSKNYHLVIDSSVGTEAAAQIISAYAKSFNK